MRDALIKQGRATSSLLFVDGLRKVVWMFSNGEMRDLAQKGRDSSVSRLRGQADPRA